MNQGVYILIDCSREGNIFLHYATLGSWSTRTFTSSHRPTLLPCISGLLQELSLPLTALAGLAVVVGRGRFTATRVAVTVANTLAYALGIPVVAVGQPDFSSLRALIASVPVGQYAHPMYSGEAHIGGKNSR